MPTILGVTVIGLIFSADLQPQGGPAASVWKLVRRVVRVLRRPAAGHAAGHRGPVWAGHRAWPSSSTSPGCRRSPPSCTRWPSIDGASLAAAAHRHHSAAGPVDHRQHPAVHHRLSAELPARSTSSPGPSTRPPRCCRWRSSPRASAAAQGGAAQSQGYAAAISMVQFVIVMIVSLATLRLPATEGDGAVSDLVTAVRLPRSPHRGGRTGTRRTGGVRCPRARSSTTPAGRGRADLPVPVAFLRQHGAEERRRVHQQPDRPGHVTGAVELRRPRGSRATSRAYILNSVLYTFVAATLGTAGVATRRLPGRRAAISGTRGSGTRLFVVDAVPAEHPRSRSSSWRCACTCTTPASATSSSWRRASASARC